MDGYTYMIERNKLLIRHARERAERARRPLTGAAGEGAVPEDVLRERLMELYGELEGCGRLARPG